MESLFCGLKLTHDGCIAVIGDGELLFSTEGEKLDNRPRYCVMNSSAEFSAILAANGLGACELTGVVVDGWGRRRGESQVEMVDSGGRSIPLDVAGYHDDPGSGVDPLAGTLAAADLFGAGSVEFRSYTHTTTHAMAGYCSSPYARAGEPSLILVWDGGTVPLLYHFAPVTNALRPLRRLTPVVGGLYPVFASHLRPFRSPAGPLNLNHQKLKTLLLPISGKAMAYAALGESSPALVAAMGRVTQRIAPSEVVRMYRWTKAVMTDPAAAGLSEASLMSSLEEFLGQSLLHALEVFLREQPQYRGLPLCFAGGSALNIKWNARLRRAGLFAGVWVPPFPNDAGSAIGAACAEMVRRTGRSALQWSVFAGPELEHAPSLPPGWSTRSCDVKELAAVLAETGEPVVVLTGRAEIGPRALGHRSIIAPATVSGMKDRLNDLKNRERYRPVAPICLEERASEVFSPGTRDPYMLFEHQVRTTWRGRVPAIVHVDGSARLQTVGPDNEVMFELLTAYAQYTDIPVLCNTSANFEGSGFFPDVASALRWGRTRFVWSEGMLYSADPGHATNEHA